MIRYPISRQELIEKIKQAKATWLARAKARTDEYIAAGHYIKGKDFWGEIKQVYIDLQHEKCAYCETKLQGAVLASKVHEVEHYRPKQAVKKWPSGKIWRKFVATWPLGDKSAIGYYKLAYEPLNYAIACTRCNSTLKSNYFPIRGTRTVDGADPQQLRDELPLLLYPIADVDLDDPSDIIHFDGVLAYSAHSNGNAYERAVTTIAFFQLNHDDLISRRTSALTDLWLALEAKRQPSSTENAQIADLRIAQCCSAKGEFSACLRAFAALYASDYARAKMIVSSLTGIP